MRSIVGMTGASLLVSSLAVAAPPPAGDSLAPTEKKLIEPTVTGQVATDPNVVEAAPAEETPAPAVDPAEAEWAETKRVAAEHFHEGKALMSEGRYAEAAGQFERSYARIEQGSVLFRMVEAYDAANDAVRALYKARQYLELEGCDGGRETASNYPCGEPDRRQNMLDRSERLLKLVGELRLQLAEGVELREVRVAEKIVPLAEFPLLVEPGSFIVDMYGSLKGQHRSYSVSVEGGGTYNVFVPPFVEPKIPGPVVDPDNREEERLQRERRRRIAKGAFWGGLGLTVASGAALGVLGGLTRNRKQTFEQQQTEFNEGESDLGYPFTAEAEFNDFKRATNAMIGVTAGLGVVTVVLGIFAFSKQSNGANASLQVRAVRLGVRPGGIVLRW